MPAHEHTFNFGLCDCGYRVGSPPPEPIRVVWDADASVYREADTVAWYTVEEAADLVELADFQIVGGPLDG